MAEGNPLNSLYPQPVAPAQNAFTDPTRAIGLLNALNQNTLQQQQIRANQGVERLYEGAINPDGTIDQTVAAPRIPSLGIRSMEGATALQSQEGQRIANATNQFGLLAGQNKHIMDAVGTLADNPNATKKDLIAIAPRIARLTGIPPTMVNGWINSAPEGGKELHDYLTAIRNVAVGSAGTQGRVTGPPTTGGAPQTVSQGEANYGVSDPNAPIVPKSVPTTTIRQPGMPTALPPGEQTIMESSAKRYEALRGTATTSPQIHADLSNLLHDSKILGTIAGPTVEMEKRANSLAQRIGIKEGVTLGKDKQAAAESFSKIVSQLASNQQKQMSDAGLHISESSNPSLMMSQIGREGVINMLRGNQDAVDRLRTEANKAKITAGKYDEWADNFGRNYDVRVFQFNRMDKEQKQKFLDAMTPAEAANFGTRYNEYHKKNWLP